MGVNDDKIDNIMPQKNFCLDLEAGCGVTYVGLKVQLKPENA